MRLIATVLGLLFSSMVSAVTLNKVVVFGDSLSDTGNLYEYMQHQLPQSPPYYEGRFTNGPVWIELLMQTYYPSAMKSHLFNYAFGGAGVSEDNEGPLFTLKTEVDSYMLTHSDKADPDALYIVWIGANNYLGVPEDLGQAVTAVTSGIHRQVERLIESGAAHIMLVNIPDLSITPFAREADLIDVVKGYSDLHNRQLADIKDQLQFDHPDLHLIFLDVNETLSDIFVNPSRYGFTNVTDTCYEEAIDLDEPSDNPLLTMVSTVKPRSGYKGAHACDGHLFFDPVHPAAGAHQIMAKKARELFDAEGLDFVE